MNFVCGTCGEKLSKKKVKHHLSQRCKNSKTSCSNCNKQFDGPAYLKHDCGKVPSAWKDKMLSQLQDILQTIDMDNDQRIELGVILERNIRSWEKPRRLESLFEDQQFNAKPELKTLAQNAITKYKFQVAKSNQIDKWRKTVLTILEATEMTEDQKIELREFVRQNNGPIIKRKNIKTFVATHFESAELRELALQLFSKAKDQWTGATEPSQQNADLKKSMLNSLSKKNKIAHAQILAQILQTLDVPTNLAIFQKSLNSRLLPMTKLATEIYSTVAEVLPYKQKSSEEKIKTSTEKWRKKMLETLKATETNISNKEELGSILQTMGKPKDIKAFNRSFEAQLTSIRKAAKVQFLSALPKESSTIDWKKLVMESLAATKMSPEQKSELEAVLKKRCWPNKLNKLKKFKSTSTTPELNKLAWQVVSKAKDEYFSQIKLAEAAGSQKRKLDSTGDEQAGQQKSNKKQKLEQTKKPVPGQKQLKKREKKLASSEQANLSKQNGNSRLSKKRKSDVSTVNGESGHTKPKVKGVTKGKLSKNK